MYAATAGRAADSSASKKKYRRTFSIASNGRGCSSVVPPGPCLARDDAGNTCAHYQPPQRLPTGSPCCRTSTEDEYSHHDEEPSQNPDRFPSSSCLLDDLNSSGSLRGISAMRTRRRLVGNVSAALGTLRQSHGFLQLTARVTRLRRLPRGRARCP